MICYKHLPDGAFLAGDANTGRTCHAYPTSVSANAARINPKSVARRMLASENALGTWRDEPQYKDRDVSWMAELQS